MVFKGTVTKEEVDEVIQRYDTICEDAFKKAGDERQIYHKHWLDSPWSGFFEGKDPLKVIIHHFQHVILLSYYSRKVLFKFL